MKRSQLATTDYLPYYGTYISLAADKPIQTALEEGMQETIAFFKSIPEAKHNFAYKEGKWTPKEILLHLVDTERVFVYRALTFARSQNEVLPGYDQDVFGANSNANSRTLKDILNEYATNRASTIALFNTFNQNTLKQKGIASGGDLSVAAAGFIICGHEVHHCNIIKSLYL